MKQQLNIIRFILIIFVITLASFSLGQQSQVIDPDATSTSTQQVVQASTGIRGDPGIQGNQGVRGPRGYHGARGRDGFTKVILDQKALQQLAVQANDLRDTHNSMADVHVVETYLKGRIDRTDATTSKMKLRIGKLENRVASVSLAAPERKRIYFESNFNNILWFLTLLTVVIVVVRTWSGIVSTRQQILIEKEKEMYKRFEKKINRKANYSVFKNSIDTLTGGSTMVEKGFFGPKDAKIDDAIKFAKTFKLQ